VNKLTERLGEVPITLFAGIKDVLAPPSHVKRLIELLPKNDIQNVDEEFHTPYVNLVQIHDYNHLDLIWGAEQDELINTPIISFLKKLDLIKITPS
jgi:pimeloyl-ACP methyl ester carboxylesterase